MADSGEACQVAKKVWLRLTSFSVTPTHPKASFLHPKLKGTIMRRIIAVVVVAVAAAACSTSPTSTDRADLQARFDGGVFGGSGNLVDTVPSTPTRTNTTTAAETEVTAADTANGRGGVFGGSGN